MPKTAKSKDHIAMANNHEAGTKDLNVMANNEVTNYQNVFITCLYSAHLHVPSSSMVFAYLLEKIRRNMGTPKNPRP